MWQMLRWHTIAAETHWAFPVLRSCNCCNPLFRSFNIIYLSAGSVSCTLMFSKKISQGTPDIRLPQPYQQYGNLLFGAALTKLLTGNSAPSSWKAFSFLLCHLWGVKFLKMNASLGKEWNMLAETEDSLICCIVCVGHVELYACT